jgi:hypothetical protein
MKTVPFSQRPTETPRASHRDDARVEYRAHHEAPFPPLRRRGGSGAAGAWLGGLGVLGIVLSAGVWTFKWPLPGQTHLGSLRLESEPPGAVVDIDGSPRGLTPITVELSPGTHAVVLTQGDDSQRISAAVTAGSTSTHHFRWTSAAATETAAGRLQVSSDPAGAAVSVDGEQRGVSPVTVDDLAPGEHQVVVQVLGRTHRRTVSIESGATASLVFTNAPVAPGTDLGWLVAKSGAQLQVFERGRRLGTTDDRIVLPAGSHELEFVGDELGFRARRTVTVSPAQSTNVTISLPQAAVNLNAVPWADVSIDGKEIGQTPIANLMLPIGAHQVVFRHPQFGEKQATVNVSLQDSARVAVDMRAK